MSIKNLSRNAPISVSIVIQLVAVVGLAVSASPASAVEPREFMMALNEGPDAIQRLLDQGLDPNQPIAGMGTPFMLAVSQEKIEIIKLLAKAGADVNLATPPMNLSPLGAVTSFGSTNTIILLLELGADPNQPQPGFVGGETPLALAKMSGNSRLVTLFEDARKDEVEAKSESTSALETRPAEWQVAHHSDDYSPVLTGAGIAVTSADNAFVARAVKDGTERWHFGLDLTSSHGEPSKTLSLIDDTVYFSGGHSDAHFYAVDASSGDLRWKFYTGGEVWRPPIEVNGTVYAASLYLGGDNASDRGVYVWIVDKKTGLELARTFIPSDSTVLSPPTVGFGMVYITVKNVLTAIDASSGQIRWQFREEDTQHFNEAFGNVMLSTGSDTPIVAVTARLRGGQGQAIYLLDAHSGRLETKIAGSEWNHNATLAGRFLYATRVGQESIPGSRFFAPKTVLTAFDAQTGKQHWQFAMDRKSKPWQRQPTIFGDRIYYWTDQGFLHAIDRNTGQPLWQFDGDRLSGYGNVNVAATDRVIYLWASSWLYAIDAASGQAKWGHPIEVYSDGDVALAGDVLIFKNRAAELVAVATGL